MQCAAQHAFEGWFASEGDFQSQLSRGLVECPLCADSRIVKMLSAHRLNLGGHSAPERNASSAEEPSIRRHFFAVAFRRISLDDRRQLAVDATDLFCPLRTNVAGWLLLGTCGANAFGCAVGCVSIAGGRD